MKTFPTMSELISSRLRCCWPCLLLLLFCLYLFWKLESQSRRTLFAIRLSYEELKCCWRQKIWKTFSVCCLFAWLWRITLNGVSFHFDGFIYILHVEVSRLLYISILSSPWMCLLEKTYGKVLESFHISSVIIPHSTWSEISRIRSQNLWQINKISFRSSWLLWIFLLESDRSVWLIIN